MTPATQKHQQLILLEPENARRLEALAKKAEVPKQVLLREAVDHMLAINGVGFSKPINQSRDSLKMCEHLAEKMLELHASDPDIKGPCIEIIVRLRGVLAQLGEPEKKKRGRGNS